MKQVLTLLAASLLFSCFGSESRTDRHPEPWMVEESPEVSEVISEDDRSPSPLTFYPAESDYGDSIRSRFDNYDHPIRVQIWLSGELGQSLDGEWGGYKPGTSIEVSFPESNHPEPRRFFTTNLAEWRRIRTELERSVIWIDAWPGIDVRFSPGKSLQLMVAIPKEDIQSDGSWRLPESHPFAHELVASMSKLEGTVVNSTEGVRVSFHASNPNVAAHYERIGRTVTTCSVTSIDGDPNEPEGVRCKVVN